MPRVLSRPVVTPAVMAVAVLAGAALVPLIGAAAPAAPETAAEPSRGYAHGHLSGHPSSPSQERRSLIVAAAGDISQCAPPDCSAERVARRVLAIDPRLVLTLGDHQYPNGTLGQFRSQYAKTWGAFRGRTRPAPGNHEYHTPGARGYFAYFGRRAHPRHGGFYSFNVRGWHFQALNSSEGCAEVRCSRPSVQGRWLRRDLRRTERSCRLAYWHHPPYSTGDHGSITSTRPMWRALARRGTDIVLNAHSHSYERFARRGADGTMAKRGVRQFVVGTGGAGLDRFVRPPTALDRKRISGRYGVLRLSLRQHAYSWRFVTAAGEVLDRGGPTRC